MFSKIKLWAKIKKAQAKNAVRKAHEWVKRIALGVLIAEMVLVGGFYATTHYELINWHGEPIVIQAEARDFKQEKPEAKEEAKPVDRVNELADLIWERESTRGKNNFSKCEAVGKVNGIGYGIPGNGAYMCFDSHEQEMEVLRGWIIEKQARGMSESAMLCLYSGKNYKGC